ncbi:MAG: hypothetical protein GC160_25195 [Acidobacteria bacterium]|nr:hypothetical protein [Acidobacteriota bacterium]
MSLRTRLQASIVALAGAIVVVLSLLYLRATITDSFEQARTIADSNTSQVESYIASIARARLASVEVKPTTADELVDVYVRAAEQDAQLSLLLEQLMANYPIIVEGLVTGPGERIVAASIPSKRGQRHAPLPSLEEFESKSLLERLEEVFSSNQDYEVSRELGFQLEGGQRRVLTIRMILSLVFLREVVLLPRLQPLAIVSGLALLLSLAAAGVVAQLAVRPLGHIGELIDRIASGQRDEAAAAERERAGSREVAAVESKLSLLGERVRGARDDAEQLRSNIDQLLTRLEDAVLLFGRDDRLVMAGGAVDRLVEGGRWAIMGRTIDEVFPLATELGAFVQSAISVRRNSRNLQVVHRGKDGEPVSLLLSIEMLEEFPSRDRIGTLVTLREAEPRRQIESRLDLSTRLAAISRLTSGAAHEIKNPLNSIALHLEVLKNKLEGSDVGAAEIEVISREIRRLDRVVRSFLDFTRPVELEIGEWDLAALLDELVKLVSPDAAEQDVEVIRSGAASAWTRGDRDLLKQAILNIIMNGIQAMSDGGRLDVELGRAGESWQVAIRDTGPGIPPENQEKIFQLYFTTKAKGSGIGLAMTFRVVQLHGGTIEFSSETGVGTEFRLQLPIAEESQGANPTRKGAELAQ